MMGKLLPAVLLVIIDHGSNVDWGTLCYPPDPAHADLVDLVLRIARFFRDESCGQCVPCRVGTVRQEEALLRLVSGHTMGTRADELALLEDVADVMRDASICGLGQTAAAAVGSAISTFGLFDGETA